MSECPVRVPILKKLPNGSFFVFSAVRERTMEKGFDHKRKADFRTPVSLANERRGGKANPCPKIKINKQKTIRQIGDRRIAT